MSATVLRRLKVAGYRSVRDLDLDLAPVNVVVGPNGCGKTNLYRSLFLLASLANLLAAASKRCQLWVTTHSEPLAGELQRLTGVEPIRLEKKDGATILAEDVDASDQLTSQRREVASAR